LRFLCLECNHEFRGERKPHECPRCGRRRVVVLGFDIA